MLLVENVLAITVFPIGEAMPVVTGFLDWSINLLKCKLLWHGTRALTTSVNIPVGCNLLHLVRVDNFSFFLKVESLFVVFGKGRLSSELFLIVGDGHRRVGIPNKTVNTPSLLAIQVITSW